ENDPNKFNKTREAGRKQLYYKIQSVTRKEIVFVYKKLQNENVFRIIGLTINLIYWIVFGFINRYQIDKSTKQYLFFKLLKEIQNLSLEFVNMKLYNKIFMPMLILVLRIELENIFVKKFVNLFKAPGAQQKALLLVNELITVIFDPHCYYNTFTLTGGNTALLKHKLSKKIMPSYKSKTLVTSNLVDQLFTKFTSPKNIINHMEKGLEKNLEEELDINEWEREKKYVAESKAMFFKFLFTKINSQLKKRNLDPIFSIQKNDKVGKRLIDDHFDIPEQEGEDEDIKDQRKFRTTSQFSGLRKVKFDI
ncbi:MAG: hypothetical protein MJ252_18450, partial [archaeon]|nr:hypothetical protein [archaeon]